MAEAKKGRKRQGVIEVETVVTVVPGQGELFGGGGASGNGHCDNGARNGRVRVCSIVP